MKFQWYVVDLDEGTIHGSNDTDTIRLYLENDNYLVFTAQHGQYFCGSTVEKEVPEIKAENDIEDSDIDGDDE